jgi:LysR family transcriptional regulator, regulator for bpeEF and oprC
MNKIHAMHAFARVVELGSFTKAARSLGSSKTNISRAVVMLEQMMCVKLLHRTNRSVAVTPQRAQHYEQVSRLLKDLLNVESISTMTRRWWRFRAATSSRWMRTKRI